MKKFVFSLLVICLTATISFAQSDEAKVTEMTEKMTTLYSLTGDQIAEMKVVQERKYRNLSEIESLKDTDTDKYILKLRALGTGHDASVKRLLTAQQRAIFDQKRVENRNMVAMEYKQLRGQEADKETMNSKIIELELIKLDNH